MTAALATFVPSWRFSNYTIRASKQRGKKIVKKGAVKIRMRVFLELGLPATMVSDSTNFIGAALVSSVARRVAWEASRWISR